MFDQIDVITGGNNPLNPELPFPETGTASFCVKLGRIMALFESEWVRSGRGPKGSTPREDCPP